MLLTTYDLDPNRFHITNELSNDLLEILPADYLNFLRSYGTGSYCDEIYISLPDTENIASTFKDFTDLWEFDDSYTAKDLLGSVQIGSTADGDIICINGNRRGKVFILPRHSEMISSFDSFFAAVDSLKPDAAIEYFDPDFDARYEQIKLIKNSALIDIEPIHRDFLRNYKYDFVVHESTQPKYIIKSLGGWVYFDLIYKSTINIKFQHTNREPARQLIVFFEQYLK